MESTSARVISSGMVWSHISTTTPVKKSRHQSRAAFVIGLPHQM